MTAFANMTTPMDASNPGSANTLLAKLFGKDSKLCSDWQESIDGRLL